MPSTARKISSARKIDKVTYCLKCKHSLSIFTLCAKYVNMGDKYCHGRRNGGNTTDTHRDPFRIMACMQEIGLKQMRIFRFEATWITHFKSASPRMEPYKLQEKTIANKMTLSRLKLGIRSLWRDWRTHPSAKLPVNLPGNDRIKANSVNPLPEFQVELDT